MKAPSRSEREQIAEQLGAIAIEAGCVLAEIADRRGGHRLKEDGSPSTDADLQAERLILSRLAAGWPDVPAIAEEAGSGPGGGELFFLVDPLDGTRDYVAGEAEYSVNIALVAGGRPVAAALAAPGLGRVWIAGETARVADIEGAGAGPFRETKTRPCPAVGPLALVSRRHGDAETEACLSALGVGGLRTASSALKFGLIASGEADVYVRCGPTMEWDTAAGDHVLACAGGIVVGPSGTQLTYGHAERGHLNGPFVALGDTGLVSRVALPRR